ncbi:efflux RND transporter periplasmic adaptor subunit [Pseudomonas sp. RIT-PI-AD]|uniref:efflux RND transporter periplasmic adaptor subunit n=1 Tax=Pseudomonas sp. RIT-PI-AD TaxID=3035294 RepID=UPI0021D976F9|nr:efflux RND transporter periplasmic adaptor subunit [Pseudomonas sp. RIT-PI-AD]
MAVPPPLSRCFVLCVVLVSGCGKEQAPEPVLPRVKVLQVQASGYAPAVTLTGDIQARVQTDLSFRVSGKMTERQVDVGARVTARQPLARLDPQDQRSNVDSAAAMVSAEQARLKLAQADFARQEKLLPKGYTSRSEYDQALATLRSAKSSLTAAQAQLANAREQLSYTTLVADAEGVITARHAEVGQVVQATVPIFSLARDGARDAVFNVYESVFAEPLRDQPVEVALLERPEIKVRGKVREVTPTVSAETGTVQVKVALEALPAGMDLGSVVSVTLQGAAQSAIEVPWSALTKSGHEPAVWLVGEEGQSRLQPVRVARYLTGKVIIAEGLQGGERVVTAGGQLLHVGQKVDIAQTETNGHAADAGQVQP